MTGLRDELRAVEHDCPGWHLWLSDAGRVWAVHVLTPAEQASPGAAGANATTVTAPTPELIRHEIACCARQIAGAA